MLVTPLNKKFGKYKPGDQFEFPDRAAAIMIRTGKFEAVTRDIVAEKAETSPDPTVAPAPRAKRTYKRRDMQAES